MLNIPMRTGGSYSRENVMSINDQKVLGSVSSQNVEAINQAYTHQQSQVNYSGQYSQPQQPAYAAPPVMQQPVQPAYTAPVQPPYVAPPVMPQQIQPAMQQQIQPAYSSGIPAASAPIVDKPIPQLQNPMQKGQKFALEASEKLASVKACLGWNIKNADCDLDVSAFLLNTSGKVPGDDWFVFYGQTTSPDGSTVFSAEGGSDREIITVDFNRLNPNISKIVFVLTINDALEKHLNFSMIKDAYIRIFNNRTGANLVSFKLEEYYANVTSMMIGELYLHNGAWKFNAVGSGVARDLAGLCELYGVQVI